MNLRVIREPTLNGTTMGIVLTDGRFYGFSLEDAVREVHGQPVTAWKKAGITAIPSGRYQIALTYSPKFGRLAPELVGVPGFSGVRIHPGNTASDTEGCILVGIQRAGVMLQDSQRACQRLQAMLQAAQDRGATNWIRLENADED